MQKGSLNCWEIKSSTDLFNLMYEASRFRFLALHLLLFLFRLGGLLLWNLLCLLLFRLQLMRWFLSLGRLFLFHRFFYLAFFVYSLIRSHVNIGSPENTELQSASDHSVFILDLLFAWYLLSYFCESAHFNLCLPNELLVIEDLEDSSGNTGRYFYLISLVIPQRRVLWCVFDFGGLKYLLAKCHLDKALLCSLEWTFYDIQRLKPKIYRLDGEFLKPDFKVGPPDLFALVIQA